MNNIFTILIALFAAVVSTSAQTARVQVIHNSADAAAATVDVYLDDALLIDDFAFRTASPFVDAPAGTEFTITIAPANSASKDDGIWSKAYTLEENETYIIIASGIVSASGYDPATAFDLYVYGMGREAAETAGKTDVLVFHGSTDAPMVDVVEVKVGAGTVVDDISYGEYQGYLSLDPAAYSLQIQTTDGTPVAQFGADLSTLGDAALTVVASGFLAPANNSDGAAFGLFVATPAGGALLELPAEEVTPKTARVQVIHNSADAAAATVDVYLDDALLIDDFAFRTASPFVDAPAGTEFTITIAPANSASKDDGIWSKAYTLEENETYIIIASGIVSASGYDPATAFDLYVYGMGREAAETAGKTDVLVFHGSTDAPMVDVVEVKVGAGTVVDDISYGEYQGYLSLDPAAYSLQIRTADGITQVAQFGADLTGLGDAALTVVASGFLAPANNSDGAAFGLFVATPAGGALLELPAEEVTPKTARVQVIHNSADAAAATVDVYLDDALLIDDFAFRTASPFVDAPAGTEFTITIAPANSASKDDGIWSKAYTLEENETYIIIASGIVSASGYDPATAFDLYVYGMGREAAETAGKTDVLVFHGSTDAPMVDVVEVKVGAGTVVDDISYGEYQGYLSLDPAAYSLQIQTTDGTPVAQFGADLTGLGDAALTVVASGFLAPANNSDGAAFGLFVATPAGGALLELPAEEVTPKTARVQVIHNSADAAAAKVDVYLDDALLIDDFAFRTASPFVDAPAGTEFTITIAPANSASKDDGIWSKAYTLEENETYIIIASGIVSASGYDPATAFDLYVYGMGREAAETAGKTDVLVFHGSTDAPTVDVVEVKVGAGNIVDDISYGEYQGYLSLDPDVYSLQIQTADGTPVAQFGIDLNPYQDAAMTIVASGFLNPANNSSGPAFGLYLAEVTGGPLQPLNKEDILKPTARVQVIHNSADAANEYVDVWIDNLLMYDDIKFREASPFNDAPAGTPFDITIAPRTSLGPSDGFWSKSFTLTEDETYILIADGIVSPSGYDPATPFDVYVYDMGREAAETAGKTDVLVFHGSTDAPTVDVAEVKVGAGTIIDDLSYGEFDGYLSLDPAVYSLQIQTADGTPVAQFGADLSTLGDAALTVVASGFLAPENNSDGAAFGLFVATAAGGDLLELPSEELPTSVFDRFAGNSIDARIYPNPASNYLSISYEMEQSGEVTVEIINITGQKMMQSELGQRTSGTHVETISLDGMENGVYMIRMTTGDSMYTSKIKIAN